MKKDSAQEHHERPPESFEGDYRPASQDAAARVQVHTEPIQLAFLMRLANALNATLDLQTIMQQTAELVRAVIDYRIFAILLLNERTNDLRMRFQVGHTPEAERRRIPHRRRHHRRGRRTARARACQRCPHRAENYISANPAVRSELAVPLIVKNRVIGVIDIQSEAGRLLPAKSTSACWS